MMALSYPVNRKEAVNTSSGMGSKQKNSGNGVKEKNNKTLKTMQKGPDSTMCIKECLRVKTFEATKCRRFLYLKRKKAWKLSTYEKASKINFAFGLKKSQPNIIPQKSRKFLWLHTEIGSRI